MQQSFQDPAELMRAWAQAVTDNDPTVLGDVFAADAEFVNLFGSVWLGRQAIIDGHAWAMGGVLKDSSMTIESIRSRLIGEEVVVLHGVCARGRSGHPSTETLPPGTTVLMMVAQRGEDGWRTVAGANIARQAPPDRI